MSRHRLIWFPVLLSLLFLSLGCGLGTVRRWVKGPAGPTLAPTPTAVSTRPGATTTTETLPTPTAPPSPAQTPPGGEVYVGEVALNMDELRQLQASVDQGHQPWRLDPLEVARDEGEELGFDPAQDTFDLLPLPDPATGQAQVLVIHGEHFYVIHLTQPVRVGTDGIWAITRVDRGL